MSKTQQLADELQQVLKAARDIAAKAEAENRDFTDEERSQVEQALEKAKGVKAQLAKAKGDDVIRSTIAELGEGVELVEGKVGHHLPAGYIPQQRSASLGETFVGSPEFKAFMGQFPSGQIPDRARVQSLPVGYKTLFKAPLTGLDDTSAGAFVQTDYTGIYDPLGRRPLTIRDLVSVRQTTSDTLEFIRQTARGNAAATVPEATTSAGPTANITTGALEYPAGSGLKPEGSMAFEKVTTTVKTIAEWVPATKRAVSDASQIRGIIDQELRADLAEEEEDQILNGNGAGENLTGLMNTSGTQSQAWDTDEYVTTRKARTLVRTVGRAAPTAYVMNPADWETIDLKRDGMERFYGAGPFAMSTPTLWGLPVVESEAMPAGTALVGDFRRAVLWDREQANITVTDSHADFFIRNMIAILAEERLAFGVIRPSAFVEIDLTAA